MKKAEFSKMANSLSEFARQAAEELAATRQQIQVIKAQLAEFEAMPLPLAEANARLVALVKEASEVWLNSGGGFDLNRQRLNVRTLAHAVISGAVPWQVIVPGVEAGVPSVGTITERHLETFGFFAWLLPDALIAALVAELEREYQRLPSPPLSTAERLQVLAEAKAKLVALESAEESMIRSAEQAGFAFERRADANPAVVLAA